MTTSRDVAGGLELTGDQPPRYIHFTNAADAAQIVAGRQLGLSRTVVGNVYAVIAGATHVPGVQHPQDRVVDAAVVFTTDVSPDSIFPEETIWRRTDPLPLRTAELHSATHAAALLDGTLPIPENGLHR